MTSTPSRKPRLALMGEFSAGKSTLANLLLGRQSSPVQVTATQLPPVWYSLGENTAERLALDGTREMLPFDDWTSVSPDQTRMISVGIEADFLHACDLIDMPGTSDPNMAPDFWDLFLPQVDFAIWCTPAAQAWRQSEAALWEQVAEELHLHSALLITRMDKLMSDRDRARVQARVQREAGDFFAAVLPISLLAAIKGREDPAMLEATGAAALVEFVTTTLEKLPLRDIPAFDPTAVSADPAENETVEATDEQGDDADTSRRILPRRIVSGAPDRQRERFAAD